MHAFLTAVPTRGRRNSAIALLLLLAMTLSGCGGKNADTLPDVQPSVSDSASADDAADRPVGIGQSEQEKRDRVAAEQAERKQAAAEQAEQDRREAEQAALDAIEAGRAEQERLAAEEQERIAAEQAEQERLAAERAEQERLAAEQAERERAATEQARIDAERAAEPITANDTDLKAQTWIVNTSSNVYHTPSCPAIKNMNESNKLEVSLTVDEASSQYKGCGRCYTVGIN